MQNKAQPTNGTFPPASDPAERQENARFHAAMFSTQLALARWQNGSAVLQVQAGAPALQKIFDEPRQPARLIVMHHVPAVFELFFA